MSGARTELRDEILTTMAEHQLDAIFYPTQALPPIELDSGGYIGSRANMSAEADMPTISVPAGFTEENHLPIGMELLGRQFAEPLLLKLSYAYEQGTDNYQPPENFGPLPNEPPEAEEYPVSIAKNGCD